MIRTTVMVSAVAAFLASASPAMAAPPSTGAGNRAAKTIYFTGPNNYGLGSVPAGGGVVKRIVSGGVPISTAVDTSGNAYVSVYTVLGSHLDLLKAPVNGSTPRKIAANVDTPRVTTDDVGSTYVWGVNRAVKILPSGKSLALPVAHDPLAVTGHGEIVTYHFNADRTTTIVTYHATGQISATRRIDLGGAPERAYFANNGWLYFVAEVGDGTSGRDQVISLKPGATGPQRIASGNHSVATAMAPDGSFYVAQNAAPGSAAVLRYPVGGGAAQRIPTPGLDRGNLSIAVDAARQIFVASSGNQPTLMKYPAVGGRPTRISTNGFGAAAGQLLVR
ncbi:MAG: hypothetical protein ABI360_00225 [Allobranchiibius sp.]